MISPGESRLTSPSGPASARRRASFSKRRWSTPVSPPAIAGRGPRRARGRRRRAATPAAARRSRRRRAARRRCRSARPRGSSSTRTGRRRRRSRRRARRARRPMPRRPSTMPTRMSGTTSARSGVWRPTIAPRSSLGRLVSGASVMIGTAIAPKATGAVLATSATEAALIGWKPRPMSMTEQIATGVPKPARASSRAPKQKAMMTACTRWSSLRRPNERRMTAKCPLRSSSVVDPDRVDDDPHDREEPEGGALGAGVERLARPASSRR